MEQLNLINTRISRQKNVSRFYVMLFLAVSFAGAIGSYYEMKSFDRQQNLETRESLINNKTK